MGRLLATASLHFAFLKYTVLCHIQMPSSSRPSTRGGTTLPTVSCSHLLGCTAAAPLTSLTLALPPAAEQPLLKTFSVHSGMTSWLPAQTKLVWTLFVCSMLTQDWEHHGKALVLLNLNELVLRLVLSKWQKYMLFYFIGHEVRRGT